LVFLTGSAVSFAVRDSSASFRFDSADNVKSVSIQSPQLVSGVHMRDATNEFHSLFFDLSQGSVSVIVQKQGLKGQMSVRPSIGMTVTDADREFLFEHIRFVEGAQHLNERVGLLAKVAEWLVEAPNKYVLANLDFDLAPVRGNGGVPPEANAPGRRLATINDPDCGCPSGAACPAWRMASDTAAIGCPATSAVAEADEGATCMCPYSGSTPRYSNYDKDTDGSVWRWNRKYGSASTDCRGRCGVGCNSFDQEAFKDCFDHDSCVDHLGGSSFSDNPNCGDEFSHAADDYVVSYGWSCC